MQDLTLHDNSLTLHDTSWGDMALIRAAGIRGFAQLVSDHGGDPAAMAREAGLAVAALHDDELLVDDVALGTVLEIAARALDVPDLGLCLAERQDLTMLGALSVAIQNSPTVGDALECTSRYLFVHARGLSVEMVADPQGVAGVMGVRYGQAGMGEVFAQGLDVGLGFLHRTTRYLLSGPYGLRGVELPHRPLAPVTRYEEFFGVPVTIGRPGAVLRVPTSLLAQPIFAANQAARRLALAHLEGQAKGSAATETARVRSALGARAVPRHHQRADRGGGRPAGDAPPHPATPARGRGHVVRRGARRTACDPGPHLPDLDRHADDPGRRRPRAERAVRAQPQLPPLVGQHAQRDPPRDR